ncbi:MAG: hypothetical protein K9I34_04150 [Bacteroidales bacterium]|nr:hypothetical protein [Bacteroidales bacterium]
MILVPVFLTVSSHSFDDIPTLVSSSPACSCFMQSPVSP